MEDLKQEQFDVSKIDEEQQNLATEIMKLVTKKNYPLHMVVSVLEMVKFDLLFKIYYNTMQSRNRIESIDPEAMQKMKDLIKK